MNHFIFPLTLLSCSIIAVMLLADSETKEMGSVEVVHQTDHRHQARGYLEVSSLQKIPSVSVSIRRDETTDGWNIQLQPDNFQFAPEDLGKAGSGNKGHAHLYIDDKKVTRLYGTWYYLNELEPGSHKIEVVLCGNDHDELVFNGEAVAAASWIR